MTTSRIEARLGARMGLASQNLSFLAGDIISGAADERACQDLAHELRHIADQLDGPQVIDAEVIDVELADVGDSGGS